MAHFYLAEALVDVGLDADATVSIEGAEAKHAVTVSRIRVGETLSIGNGAGLVVTGAVVAAEPGRLSISADEVVRHPLPSPTITLVQALAKGGRDEAAVQAATELGVDAIVPWSAARSIVRWDAAKREKGRERWRSIAREATKQSIRPHLPLVGALESTTELARRGGTATVIVLDPTAQSTLGAFDPDGRDIVLVVGPEGGIDEREFEHLVGAGAIRLRLGDSILRTSTAGPAAIAVLNARLGRW